MIKSDLLWILLFSDELESWTEVFLSISSVAHHSVHLNNLKENIFQSLIIPQILSNPIFRDYKILPDEPVIPEVWQLEFWWLHPELVQDL